MKRLSCVPGMVNTISFFCAVLFLLGVAAVRYGVGQLDLADRLKHEAQTVLGVVTAHLKIPGKGSPRLQLQYEYLDGVGNRYLTEDEVRSDVIQRFPVGSPVMVTFIKSDPIHHTITGTDSIVIFGDQLNVIGWVLIFVSFLLLPKTIRLLMLNRSLAHRGIRCDARVTEVRNVVHRSSKGRYTQHFIDFEYFDEIGQKYLGTYEVASEAKWKKAMKNETAVKLVYLPEKPEKFQVETAWWSRFKMGLIRSKTRPTHSSASQA